MKIQKKKKSASFVLRLLFIASVCGICTTILYLSDENAKYAIMAEIKVASNVMQMKEKVASNVLQKSHVYERPQECTTDQLEQIKRHLLPDDCTKYKKSPWLQRCSFTIATMCIRATWLTNYYKDLEGITAKSPEHFVGISVGCNKGGDALDTLRMGTSNDKFDKRAWHDAMQSDGAELAQMNCAHEANIEEQYSTDPAHTHSGEMHCIEPFPPNYNRLKDSAEKLGIDQEGFVVVNAAISKKGGVTIFPTGADQKVGVENLSMSNCATGTEKKIEEHKCQEVDGFTLETYVEKYVKSKGPIHVLSIDVEGYDFDVMIGGKTSVLDRVQYLEFEYNWMGSWAKQNLSDTLQMLDEHSFTCYWAGDDALYRISGCWQEYYNINHWANVACVHRTQYQLAKNMEEIFLRTLSEDHKW